MAEHDDILFDSHIPISQPPSSIIGLNSPETFNKEAIFVDDEDDITFNTSDENNLKRNIKDLTGYEDEDCCGCSQKEAKKEIQEKRLKRFRTKAPSTYKQILNRATTQNFRVLERQKTGSPENPEETIEIIGSTGNLYTVVINKIPSCTCPHARKGFQCKHIVHVLAHIFKVRPTLQYQLAFLHSEITEILTNAPPIPSKHTNDEPALRKPIAEDCPICSFDFIADDEQIIYCKAACGNNIHKACFDKWAASRVLTGGGITCPFCRSPWEGEQENLPDVSKTGNLNDEGYVNVGDQVGFSGLRDYSSYHQPWVTQQMRRGNLRDAPAAGKDIKL